MNRWLLLLGLGLAAALLFLLLLPPAQHVQRSTVVHAPIAVVFSRVNTPRQVQLLCPWLELDSTARPTYEGPDNGLRARMTWNGGTMLITESVPGERVAMSVTAPGVEQGTAVITLKAMGDSTRVTYTLDRERDLLQRIAGLFSGNELEAAVGPAIAHRLARLAALPARSGTQWSTTMELVRVVPGAQARVWQAFTTPALFTRWWGPKAYTCLTAKMDPRVDGHFLASLKDEQGVVVWETGTYDVVDAPFKLAFTDSFADSTGRVVPAEEMGYKPNRDGEQHVIVELAAQGPDSTRIHLLHEHAPRGGVSIFAGYWNQAFDKMATVFTPRSPH